MSLWKKTLTLDEVNSLNHNTLMQQLDIRFTEMGDDYLTASMPVDHRTHQPMGILHGGASVALAETVGSLASLLASDEYSYGVGLEINANHVKAISQGTVFATARALHIGSKTHVWDIRICNEQGQLICVSRFTVAILQKR